MMKMKSTHLRVCSCFSVRTVLTRVGFPSLLWILPEDSLLEIPPLVVSTRSPLSPIPPPPPSDPPFVPPDALPPVLGRLGVSWEASSGSSGKETNSLRRFPIGIGLALFIQRLSHTFQWYTLTIETNLAVYYIIKT